MSLQSYAWGKHIIDVFHVIFFSSLVVFHKFMCEKFIEVETSKDEMFIRDSGIITLNIYHF